MAESAKTHPISSDARQSAPLDLTSALDMDPTFIRGKTILITGGASGLGAAFFSAWAPHGATIVIGDIDIEGGKSLVDRVKTETGSQKLHFLKLDVKSWRSQVAFFREAVKLSPHGGIDTVVANAGINIKEEAIGFENPAIDFDNNPNPPPPKFSTIDVNLFGMLYTTHLALYFLPRNPGSQRCSLTSTVSKTLRDRHLLLVGSLASLYPIPGHVPYGVSKHAVIALYRSLRTTAPIIHGVRLNLLCPYFIDTPLISTSGKLLLAGCALAKVQDAVKAAARFVADPTCIGRSLVVGPRVKIRCPKDENGDFLAGGDGVPNVSELYEYLASEEVEGDDVLEKAIWECYAHDLEDSDVFVRRVVQLTKAAAKARGTRGFVKDIFKLLTSRFDRRSKN